MRIFAKKRRKMKCIIFVLVTALIIVALTMRVGTLFNSLAQSKARFEATYAINKVIGETTASAGNSYSNIIIKEYDGEGKITAVSTDSALINRMQSEISSRLIERFRENNQYYITLSIANILGMRTITGFGPKVPIKISPSPNISVKFDDSFISAGINQTKFAVSITVEAEMMVSAIPFRTSVGVDRTIPVAQVVLVGSVPDTYADFNGKFAKE